MELGNLIFNPNQSQSYYCPDYVVALLEGIDSRLHLQLWNETQQDTESPFYNTGASFKNDTFEVEAYNWNEDICQPYNFKWRDVEISWYKHLGRDTRINKKITPNEAKEMFDECIKSLDK
jgi:hypothetical protein